MCTPPQAETGLPPDGTLAAAHIAELERKISELSGLRDTLKELMDNCQGNDRPDCPILKDLESGCCH